MDKKILACCALIFLVFIAGCGKSEATGQAASTPNIFESGNFTAEKLDVNGQIRRDNSVLLNESEEVFEVPNETPSVAESEDNFSVQQPETAVNEAPAVELPEEFKFSPESIVSAQNNISLSLDGIKHEIKSEYWGKITEITFTILNNGNKAFKPKAIVILYDEKDPKEERFKPKAEINFDIEKLEIGGHAARDAIVSVSFDDIALTKKFELVVVDAADLGNKPLVVAEYDFNAFNSTLGN